MTRLIKNGANMSTLIKQIIVALILIVPFAEATGAESTPDKSGTRPNVISMPKGPGTVEGLGESFSVNLNTGSVTETIPITLPPGTNGMSPPLALTQGNRVLVLLDKQDDLWSKLR